MTMRHSMRPIHAVAIALLSIIPSFDGVSAQNVASPTSPLSSSAKLPPLGPSRALGLGEFLATVDRSNPDYASQRSMVMGVDAQRQVARLFPNPTFSAGYSADITGAHMPATFAPGITQTVVLGRKIAARSDVADRTYQQAVAQYDDFGRTLRATAASAYVDALVAELEADRRRQSAEAVDQLAAANQARFSAGEIGEVDLLQSRVEQLRFRADFLGAESSRRQALLALSLFMGIRGSDTVYVPTPYRAATPRAFDLRALIDTTLLRRPDVIAARRAADVAVAGVRLAHANRVSDVDLGFSMLRSSQSDNSIAPSPSWQAASAALTFTIPLTNIVNTGDLNLARYAVDQAQHAVVSAEVRAENEVRQAHARYTLAVERLNAYSGELLADADRVLTARTYSYQRGAASLTDVLIAQQAANDVYIAYSDALGEYLKSLIAVQVAAGLAEVGF
jgi:cobalt-zinc-cadmium efflux system outer membrane protein